MKTFLLALWAIYFVGTVGGTFWNLRRSIKTFREAKQMHDRATTALQEATVVINDWWASLAPEMKDRIRETHPDFYTKMQPPVVH